MYVSPNFKSKKALKEALSKGEPVSLLPQGLETAPVNGKVTLEGPHYPEPHKWYASGTVVDGKLTKVS